MNVRRVLFFLIITLAASVWQYSPAMGWFTDLWHRGEILGYTELADQVPSAERQQIAEAAREYNDALYHETLRLTNERDDEYYQSQLRTPGSQIMGKVHIPSLNIALPVYRGVGGDTLRVGVGHIYGTSLPVGGENTHSVLVAHSGMMDARMFTDLPDLEIGAGFSMTTAAGEVCYQTYHTEEVTPDQVDHLQPIAGEDLMTLITCTPVGINTHRLLVHGTRVECPEGDNSGQILGFREFPGFPWWTLYLGGAMALSIVVGKYLFPKPQTASTKAASVSPEPQPQSTNPHPATLIGRLATATTVGILALTGVAAPSAVAAPIYTQSEGTLTLYKYSDITATTLVRDGKLESAGASPIPGATIRAVRLDVDINSLPGLAEWNRQVANGSVPGNLPTACVAPRCFERVTDANGVAAFALPVGAYYVYETATPRGASAITPLLITVPVSNGSGGWAYNVHVYPKDSGSVVTPTTCPENPAQFAAQNPRLEGLRWWRVNGVIQCHAPGSTPTPTPTPTRPNDPNNPSNPSHPSNPGGPNNSGGGSGGSSGGPNGPGATQMDNQIGLDTPGGSRSIAQIATDIVTALNSALHATGAGPIGILIGAGLAVLIGIGLLRNRRRDDAQ